MVWLLIGVFLLVSAAVAGIFGAVLGGPAEAVLGATLALTAIWLVDVLWRMLQRPRPARRPPVVTVGPAAADVEPTEVRVVAFGTSRRQSGLSAAEVHAIAEVLAALRHARLVFCGRAMLGGAEQVYAIARALGMEVEHGSERFLGPSAGAACWGAAEWERDIRGLAVDALVYIGATDGGSQRWFAAARNQGLPTARIADGRIELVNGLRLKARRPHRVIATAARTRPAPAG